MKEELVSIIVATYNSAKFVIETLESAKAQTWQNIELIVSDDCSADNTVALCRHWMAENQDRFVRTEMITVPKNTGVSANCNRCIKATRSNWIKMIAGDDILLPNCIEDNMQFVQANNNAAIIFSQVLLYQDYFTEDHFVGAVPQQFPMNLMDPKFSATDQYKLLLLSDRINYTPSYFFKKSTLVDIGGYDEENKMVEDYPMWLTLTKAGNSLYYFHKATVGYRRHQQATSNNNDVGIFKSMLLKSGPLKKKYTFPYLPWDIAGREKYTLAMSQFFQWAGINKNKAFFKWLYKMSTVYLNPFRYIVYFKKKVLKLGSKDIFYAN